MAQQEQELTPPKAAQRAGCTRDAVNKAIRAGALPARLVETPRGPVWLVKPADVDAWTAVASQEKRRGRPRKALAGQQEEQP